MKPAEIRQELAAMRRRGDLPLRLLDLDRRMACEWSEVDCSYKYEDGTFLWAFVVRDDLRRRRPRRFRALPAVQLDMWGVAR